MTGSRKGAASSSASSSFGSQDAMIQVALLSLLCVVFGDRDLEHF